jgi:hypothetical protein
LRLPGHVHFTVSKLFHQYDDLKTPAAARRSPRDIAVDGTLRRSRPPHPIG